MRGHLAATLMMLLAISIGACAALMQQPPSTKPDDVVELAKGVYFRHGDLAGRGHSNNGFVVFNDFVLVIDANFPSGAKACLDDIRKVTRKPVRFVFDTHHHGDHAYGNPVWLANGAVPVAQENVVRELGRFEPERWKGAAASREDIKNLDREGPAPPVVTFPRRLVFDDGTRRVELLHFGTAHTRGDGFAYLPREKILFTGDVVVNGPHNFMGDGNTESWLRVLDALGELDVDIVAPGHGPCGDRSLIADQRDYIALLRQAVADGIDDGKSIDEIEKTVEVSQRLIRYRGSMFRSQIAKMYSEINGLEMPLELEELGFREDPATARGEEWRPPGKIVFSGNLDQVEALRRVADGVKIVAARDPDKVLEEVVDAQALLGRISAEALRRGKNLRWVHSFSAGVERYIGIGTPRTAGIDELKRSDIILTNGQRCHGVQIADQVVSYLLAFTRQLKRSIEGKSAPAEGKSRWASVRGEGSHLTELRGKTMLIVGVGGIGSQVALRAAGFGMRILGVDPQLAKPPPGVSVLRPPEGLSELLPQAQVLVLSCPLTSETRGLIGKEELALLPEGAYLINVSRGRTVDADSLVEALRAGRLAGAGLDVTEPEPLPDSSPLWTMDNVIITPHVGGRSDGSGRRSFLLVRENIRRFVRGEPLLNVVDKGRGY